MSKDRLALVAPMVVALGHDVIARRDRRVSSKRALRAVEVEPAPVAAPTPLPSVFRCGIAPNASSAPPQPTVQPVSVSSEISSGRREFPRRR
jgi:hypothetical protein